MFYGAEVNVRALWGEGWLRMKASRQSALGKQREKKNKRITKIKIKREKYICIFLFIANRDGLLFGKGAGTINHNRVNCWPADCTTGSPM